MYVREIYKRMIGSLNDILPSTDSTSFNSALINSTSLCNFPGLTARTYGRNYSVTIQPTTGGVYAYAATNLATSDIDEPTSSNAYYIAEDEVVTLRVPYLMAIKGDSTTAAFKAAIWSDE